MMWAVSVRRPCTNSSRPAGTPPLAVLGGKLTALAIVVAIQFLIVTIIGIIWQVTHGAPQINISHYGPICFLAAWTSCLMAAA